MSTEERPRLIIGTRGSPLALAQSTAIRDQLRARHPHILFDLLTVRTTGDDLQKARENAPAAPLPLSKGLFTKEIEQALLAETIDIAVHSLKDLPVEEPEHLTLAAIPEREDPRDLLITKDPCLSLQDLPEGATLATGSPRRMAELLRLRTDLRIVPVRGNVDTRLRKLREHDDWHGILLAAAGVARLHPNMQGCHALPLDAETLLPAPGQGALGIQVRRKDTFALTLCAALDHRPSRLAASTERAFLAGTGGGCRAPLGAWAHPADANAPSDLMLFHGRLYRSDGTHTEIRWSAPPEDAVTTAHESGRHAAQLSPG